MIKDDIKYIDIKIRDKDKEKEKRLEGSALVENILLIAISLVLIVVIFYPQIVNMFNKVMDSLSIWFENAISAIGVVK